MPILFKKTKQLEAQVEEFLEAISEGAIVFKLAIKDYLDGETDKFEDRIVSIDKLESKADNLRRTVENQLYSQSLSIRVARNQCADLDFLRCFGPRPKHGPAFKVSSFVCCRRTVVEGVKVVPVVQHINPKLLSLGRGTTDI